MKDTIIDRRWLVLNGIRPPETKGCIQTIKDGIKQVMNKSDRGGLDVTENSVEPKLTNIIFRQF